MVRGATLSPCVILYGRMLVRCRPTPRRVAARTTHREGGRGIRRARGNSRRQVRTAGGGCAAQTPHVSGRLGPARSNRRPWREVSLGLTVSHRGIARDVRPEARKVEEHRREANRDRRNVRQRKRVFGLSPVVHQHPVGPELP